MTADPAAAVRARGLAPGGLARAACPLCGGRDLDPQLDLRGRSLLRCRSCGVRCTDEYAEGEAVRRYYSRVQAHEGKVPDVPGVDAFDAIARFQADAIESVAGPRRHGRLLDVGCSRGHLLAELEVRGWEVAGIDVSEASVEEARRRIRAPVWLGEPEDAPFEAGSFDRVVMLDVLAHLPHPIRTLRAVRDLLKPGGELVLSTVDDDWKLAPLMVALFRALPVRLADLRDEMYEGQHYCYFGHRTVGRLLAEAGLELAVTQPQPPLSARFFVHQYPLARRVALAGMTRIDRLLGSSRKMIVLATRPREATGGGAATRP